jgi:PTH1 family peptidyl-tRNA hydrolase
LDFAADTPQRDQNLCVTLGKLMGQPIELIAGLGNPDPEYLATRHNAGFWFADALAAKLGATFRNDKKLEGLVADTELDSQRLRLLKPTTFMNHSGRSVAKALNYYKIPSDRLLVVYDELDLPPGRAKLKFDGGHAGHNGMRSIIEHVGSTFWRIRLGVGHPGDRERVVGHVLHRASADEERSILETIAYAIDALGILVGKGEQAAKNDLHSHQAAADESES